MRMAQCITALGGVLFRSARTPAAMATWPLGATVPTTVSTRCTGPNTTAAIAMLRHVRQPHAIENECQIATHANGATAQLP